MIKEVEIFKQNSYKRVLGLVWQQWDFSYDFTIVFYLFKKLCGHIV
jgi:hypothetical protein